MSLDLHPILDAGIRPKKNLWYAVAPEGSEGPTPRVGASANFVKVGKDVGKDVGKVLLSAGATPDGPYEDLYQLSFRKGIVNCSL